MFLLLLSPMALGQRTLRGTEVKVTTVTNRPFMMPNNLSSAGERWLEKSKTIDLFCFSLRYEGFLVDMLEELSTMLGFTFTIHENPNWSLISEVTILNFRPIHGYRSHLTFSHPELTQDHVL